MIIFFICVIYVGDKLKLSMLNSNELPPMVYGRNRYGPTISLLDRLRNLDIHIKKITFNSRVPDRNKKLGMLGKV